MSATEITLAPEQLEQLADAIAARLAPASGERPDLVTAEELAQLLRVDTKTVYRRADELGAVRIGRRVMFDPNVAIAARRPEPPKDPRPAQARTRATRGKPELDLLPVGRRTR